MVFKTYKELRRVSSISRIIINLLLDLFISRLYQKKKSDKISILRLLLAEIIRLILGKQKSSINFSIQLRKTLERLGSTYVKLGQMLSLREDILPERITRELRKLQDQVPPVPFKQIKKLIESEFGKPLNIVFRSFEEKPIAAASLAQVHRAVLKDGKKVVVKLQRPRILQLTVHDTSIMRRLAFFLERIPSLKEYQPVKFVEEFTNCTMKELDFVQEGKHTDQFRENFKRQANIIFPEIYWDYTSHKIITMKYIEGIKPDDTEKIKRLGIDSKKFARIGARVVLKMLYIDGFFHADLHPGNLLIVGRSKLCILDSGMVGSFSEKARRNMFLYFYYMVIQEFSLATNYLINLTISSPNANIKGFQEELQEAIKKWSGLKFKHYPLGRLIFETMNIGARHYLYFDSNLILSSRTLLTVEAVGALLDPDLDLSKVSKPIIEKIFIKYFSPARLGKAILHSLPNYMDFLENLPQNLLNTFSMVSSGRFKVEISDRKHPIEKKQKSSSISWSILSASLILGGTLFSISEKTPGPLVETFLGLTGLPVIALFMFGFATISLIISMKK